MIKKIAAALLSAAITCAAHAEAQPSVGLIKPVEPMRYQMKNDLHLAAVVLGAFGPLLANKARNMAISSEFNAAMMRLRPNFAALVNDELKKSLEQNNIKTFDYTRTRPNPSDPDNVRFAAINPDNKVMIYPIFSFIGVRSHHNTSFYQPTINLIGCVITAKYRKDCTDSYMASYGDNYDEDDELVTVADENERWPDQEAVLLLIDDVEKALRRGLTISAQKLGKQLAEFLVAEKLVAAEQIQTEETPIENSN